MVEEQQQRGMRHRRSRAEADRLVEEFEQSGLTRRAFCRERGLSVVTLDKYRKRRSSCEAALPNAASCSQGRSAIKLVPLEVVEAPVSQETAKGATLFVELAGNRRIGVAAGFDAATLKRLIALLEQA